MTKAREIAELGQNLTVDASGNLGFSGDIELGDNNKAIFGAGSDLQIYHDGSNSLIQDSGTGDLILKSNGTATVVKTNAGNNLISARDAGSVGLFHNGSEKLTTTSTGIDVTGTAVMDGLTVDGDAVISSANARLRLKETDTTDNDTQLQTTGGVFKISRLDDNNATATQRLSIDNSTGDISFYDSAGSSQSFFWDASAESLGIGVTSPSAALHIDVADPEVRIEDSNNGTGGTSYRPNVSFFANGDEVGSVGMRTNRHMDIVAEDFNSAQIRMFTGGSQSAVIDSSGNVGIGTSSPRSDANTTNLHVSSSQVARVLIESTATNGKEWGLYSSASGGLGFYDYDTANNRMIIDSSGRVGIGTISPATSAAGTLLKIDSAGSTRLNISAANVSYSAIDFGDTDDVDVGRIEYYHANNAMLFHTNAAERMRIDSSGNVLVGKTSAGIANTGFEAQQNGNISATREGTSVQPTLRLNKLTNDGSILRFDKDGSEVGSIGVQGGDAYYAGTSKGIKAVSGFIGATNTTGVLQDNNTDLGSSSYRFKDLYLSGGVYLGGTGSANKLDDYEEGDHEVTVTTGSGTVTLTTGGRHIYYVKVGGLVTITGTIRVDSVSSPSGTCTIGLPFVNISPASGEGQVGAMVVPNIVNSGNVNELALEIGENASVMNIYKASGTNLTDGGDIFKANTTLRFNFSYRTSA